MIGAPLTPAAPSLTRRIALLLALWTVLAVSVTATIVIAVYARSVSRDFQAVLSAHLTTLVAGVAVRDGMLVAPEALTASESRFALPGSGWYWSVEPIEAASRAAAIPNRSAQRVASPSLGTAPIPVPPDAPPFEGLDYRRAYRVGGPNGAELQGVESEIELEGGRPFRFRVFGNKDESDRRVREFALTLLLALGGLGLGTVLAGIAVVRLGLRPLERMRLALQDVREGRAERIVERAPREVAPLVDEVNALVASNRRIVERARTQVGNLAHGLKTPLAVIVNESRLTPDPAGATLREQAGRMRAQIDGYLDRARIAAGARGALTATPVAPTLERVVGAVRKLRPDRRIEWSAEPPPDLVFEGERHDLEEVAGNLVENAAKWARRTIWIGVERRGVDRFALVVEDDGPGLPEGTAASALRRGVRLDESVEGTGLGLSIVGDIVSEYGGGIALERSEAGGLRAVAILPLRPVPTGD